MIFSCLRCGKKEDDDRDRLKKKLKEKKTEEGEQYSIDVQMRSGLVCSCCGNLSRGRHVWVRPLDALDHRDGQASGYLKPGLPESHHGSDVEFDLLKTWQN